MYDELIKRLRNAAKMSEALAVLLPHSEGNAMAKLYNEAADAIEELSKLYINERIAAVDLTGKLAKMPFWIPVTERLPEKNGHYLIAVVGGEFGQIGFITIAFYHKRFIYNERDNFDQITHWMPLPEPPKEE